MESLEFRVLNAKENNKEIEPLLEDYIPFIKKQLSKIPVYGLEYDDMLSIAMLAFVGAVKSYEKERGTFLNFAALMIRSRIIDESRKQQNYQNLIIPLPMGEERDEIASVDLNKALEVYDRERERERLADEINILSQELESLGIGFSGLSKNCPKQKRARNQCFQIASTIVREERWRELFLKSHKIDQNGLSREFGISAKTIEKHKKYIITVAVLLLGDYPNIRTFLPVQEVGQK